MRVAIKIYENCSESDLRTNTRNGKRGPEPVSVEGLGPIAMDTKLVRRFIVHCGIFALKIVSNTFPTHSHNQHAYTNTIVCCSFVVTRCFYMLGELLFSKWLTM
jgi:hypothetical protein